MASQIAKFGVVESRQYFCLLVLSCLVVDGSQSSQRLILDFQYNANWLNYCPISAWPKLGPVQPQLVFVVVIVVIIAVVIVVLMLLLVVAEHAKNQPHKTPYMASFGHVGPFDQVWPHKALFGSVWPRLTLFGTIWPRLVPLSPSSKNFDWAPPPM